MNDTDPQLNDTDPQLNDTDPQPQIDVWYELVRPMQTKRAQVGIAVLGLLTSATMHVIALVTDHYSVSSALAASLALVAPAIVFSRFMTGRPGLYSPRRR